MAKRTTVQIEVEVEGPVASGDQVVEWLSRIPRVRSLYHEDRFRILRVNLLGEER